MTEEAQGAREDAPFLRDLDAYLYIRHYRGRYLIGAFEPNGKPKRPGEIPTDGFVEFGPDWDHFAPVLQGARERVPEIETIGFSHYLRAPESFTPDSNFQLGFVPEVPGLFVAAGFNSQGIIFGPGRGHGRGAVDRGGPSHDGPGRGRRGAHRAVGEPARLAARAHGGIARRPLRDALAGQAAQDRPRGAARAAVRRAPRGGRRVRPGGRMGARQLVRARRGGARGHAFVRCAVVVPGGARRGARDPRGRRALRPVDLREVPRAGAGRARRAAAPRDLEPRRGRWVASSTRCSATRAAASRWTRP